MDRSDLLGRFDLTDRVVIVTGGSRGIGRAAAIGLASLGAKVVVASRKADACVEVADEIRAAGGTALAIPAHMGDLDAIRTLVAQTVDELGGIDVVVNNAANALTQPIGSITAEAFTKSIDVNLRGPLFCVQEALPFLEASDHGVVINLVSVGIYTGGQGMALYLAAKNALEMLTRTMAHELAPRGIRVNALCPGVIDTDMVRNNPPEVRQFMLAGQPMGRMGRPDELVPAFAFLASEASSFMTGQTLVIDGGQTSH